MAQVLTLTSVLGGLGHNVLRLGLGAFVVCLIGVPARSHESIGPSTTEAGSPGGGSGGGNVSGPLPGYQHPQSDEFSPLIIRSSS